MSNCEAEMMLSLSQSDGDNIISLSSLVREYSALHTHTVLSVFITSESSVSSITLSVD